MKSKPEKAKCPKCEYEWWTRSDKEYVSCPNCQSKTKQSKVIQNKGD